MGTGIHSSQLSIDSLYEVANCWDSLACISHAVLALQAFLGRHVRQGFCSCAGMSDMAQMLFTELRPFLAEAQGANLPVTFGAPV